jgi:hypothetical protein
MVVGAWHWVYHIIPEKKHLDIFPNPGLNQKTNCLLLVARPDIVFGSCSDPWFNA